MSEEKNCIPKRRFIEFQNAAAWEQRKLSEMATGTYGGGTPPTSNEGYWNGNIPWIQSSDLTENQVSGVAPRKHISEAGLRNSATKLIPQNSIAIITRVGVGKLAVMPFSYTTSQDFLSLSNLKADVLFSVYAIYKKLQGELNAVQGTSIKGITKDELLSKCIFVPEIEEQKKIGQFFNQLDNLITLHQRKLEKMKSMKAAYLTEMFPQEGESIPKRRFAGFTDAWEQRKFGEMAEYKKGPFGSALKKDIFIPKSRDAVKVYEQQNAINKNWKLERYFITKDYANKLNVFETCAGDIIVSCAGTIGEMYELPLDSEPGVINQALMRVRTNNNVVDKSFYQILFLNMIDNFSKEHSNGSAMKNIPPLADLKPMLALIPDIQEQKKISFYFRHLDNLITLHQHKLDKLQNIKKAYLNEMFI